VQSMHQHKADHAKYMVEAFKVQQQLQSRDYSFILHSEQKLKSLFMPFL